MSGIKAIKLQKPMAFTVTSDSSELDSNAYGPTSDIWEGGGYNRSGGGREGTGSGSHLISKEVTLPQDGHAHLDNLLRWKPLRACRPVGWRTGARAQAP